jgi:ribosomal protein S18 acetylase RimI-like enzyme
LKRRSDKSVSQSLKRTKKSPPEPSPAEQLKSANALPLSEFTELYFPKSLEYAARDGTQYSITPQTSANLGEEELTRCFNLIQETSSADYEASSDGWDPVDKRKEMKEVDMRYLLVRRSPSSSQPRPESEDNPANVDSEIVAFLSFMLTTEASELVIYIYEVHSDSCVRGIGLGKFLMGYVEEIGRNAGMLKSMLTVFTRNTHAESFYRRLGYIEDEISPRERKLRRGKVKRPEYLILSKILQHEGNS